MHYRLIARYIGQLLVVIAVAMLTSIPWALLLDTTDTAMAFVWSTLVTAGCGSGLWAWGRGQSGTLFRRDALFIVAASWLLLGVFGGLPYMFDGALPNPVDAYFEATSGFTTTGSTVVTNIEGLSHALHWWRSLTHWLGGMGIVVLFIAIFPRLGVGGRHLFKTEVPGPITEGLKPKIRETALALWGIYVALTIVCAVALWLIGPGADDLVTAGLSVNAEMDVHNALCHAFATMATGGFSTLNNSVAGFDSVAVDVVITIFMFLAGVNFSLYYLVLKKRLKEVLRDRELWAYTALVVLATLLVTVDIWHTGPTEEWASHHRSIWQSLRYAVFQVVGVVTTTGFGTDNFDVYPPLSRLFLVVLMFVGGMAGSTAGGMKVFRFVVIYKAILNTIRTTIRPNAIYVPKINNRPLGRGVAEGIVAFFALGVLTFAVASLAMAAMGLDIVTATTSVSATLFNIGPGLAKVGSIENFAHIPLVGKCVLSFCMVLGRLEFYALLALFLPTFWSD